MSVIEAIAGFGAISIGVPILSFYMGAEASVALFTAIGLFMLAIMLVTQFRKIKWREFLIILCCILPIMPVGYLLFAKLRYVEWALRLIIGILVTSVSGREILHMIRGKEQKNLSRYAMYASLATGAVLQGMFSMGAPLINIYALSRMKDKGTFRATMAAVWIVTNIISTFYRVLVLHVYTEGLTLMVVYALPLVIVAFLAGNWLHYKIPNEKFSSFVYIIQFVAGLISITGGIIKLFT